MHRFKSCFIVDVSVAKDAITLTDSVHCKYAIDVNNSELMAQFKTWFKNVFSAGVAGTLSVFEYEDRGSDGDFDFHVIKFLLKDAD